MCGIIGRISVKEIEPKKTFFGLKELEYRGYDSFGLLLYNTKNNSYVFEKDIGEFDLEKFSSFKNFKSNMEIGHTRWATHGGVSQENAHPHFDSKKEFFVVMNGIVENFSDIKTILENKGITFNSETDTEIIPMLFSYHFNKIQNKNKDKEKGKNKDNLQNNLLKCLKKVISELSGEFSFLIKYKNFLIGYKNINPIIIGKSQNGNEIFISSDSNLVENNSDEYFILEDEESFLCNLENTKNTKNPKTQKLNFSIFNKNFNKISKKSFKSSKKHDSTSKETKYFMEKEILEQKNLKNLLTPENIKSIDFLLAQTKTKKIYLTGAGTSYHAAIFMHYTLLNLGFLSQTILASELKNYSNIIKDSLIVVFSQSGETADLIYPLRTLHKNNEIFTITNTKNSTLDRFAQKSIYLNCGREIAVASTKAFTSQIFVSATLESRNKNVNLSDFLEFYEKIFDMVLEENQKALDTICFEFKNVKNFFFIGRDKNYPLAFEGALKLKEISYIHAEGFAGGELKHGSLALIEQKTPVIVIGDGSEILSNAMEIKSRGGIIIGISEKETEIYDFFLKVPSNFKEIFSTILMQILALKMTIILGYNPDKPRNLAKSVTVK